ncbi:hypothetical protein [Streptomonospora litoralis]|uniref:Uncharacterized protein n=1 Tax=Streptomonospora litoralis TaxID=2498135 RepID=A0A4P6QB08_9ACTN|nr:hypothetical protein [Streptomonospora litoralis]QBI56829.1 hypothetical protein EKD16_25445 [Streptomonospora litoralis]
MARFANLDAVPEELADKARLHLRSYVEAGYSLHTAAPKAAADWAAQAEGLGSSTVVAHTFGRLILQIAYETACTAIDRVSEAVALTEELHALEDEADPETLGLRGELVARLAELGVGEEGA